MKNKRFFPILGMIVGAAMVIVGLFVFESMDAGIWVNSKVFGADFYTESHHATASAASNVYQLGEMISSGFTALFLFLGLIDICYFGCKLPKKEKETSDNAADTVGMNADNNEQ